MQLTLTFWKDQSVLTTLLQIIAFVLLLVALIFCCATIGVLTQEFNNHMDIAYDADVDKACFLYVTENEQGIPEAGENPYCGIIIAGQGIIFIALVALIILLLVTFIRFGFGVIEGKIFLTVAIISSLLSLVATIVLSAGFGKTCETINDNKILQNLGLKCSDLTAYDAMRQSTAFSWIETISIDVLVAVAYVYLIMRVRERINDRESNDNGHRPPLPPCVPSVGSPHTSNLPSEVMKESSTGFTTRDPPLYI